MKTKQSNQTETPPKNRAVDRSVDRLVGCFSRDERASLAHALFHLTENHITDDREPYKHGWYCGNREHFINRHKKAIALLQSILKPNVEVTGDPLVAARDAGMFVV